MSTEDKREELLLPAFPTMRNGKKMNKEQLEKLVRLLNGKTAFQKYVEMAVELNGKSDEWKGTEEGEAHLDKMDVLWDEMSEEETAAVGKVIERRCRRSSR